MSVTSCALLPVRPDSVPLGVSYAAELGSGIDLAAFGYLEEEYLIEGSATEWTYAEPGGPAVPRTDDVPYVSRLMVRRPIDPGNFSGVLQVEPLHPNLESAYTWENLHPWIMRTGGAWVGITQDARSAELLRESFDPARYAAISIPLQGLGYDIVGQVVTAIRSGALDGLSRMQCPVQRAYLSGWSITGSFCRVFIGDGFHQRHRQADGSPIFDGYVIGISSGGAGISGYPPLSEGTEFPAPDDPRRTATGLDVPVIEVLSEFESETHADHVRPDSDEPGDRYRLYQIAGTSHVCGRPEILTNRRQLVARGVRPGKVVVNEVRSDARMDFFSRAVFANLDAWVQGGSAPRAGRFGFGAGSYTREWLMAGARPLQRDAYGNVVGGVRTPWIDVPVASYQPHATPDLATFESPLAFPQFGPQQQASLVGTMALLPADTLRDLYGSREHYLELFEASCVDLVDERLLLPEESAELIEQARTRSIPLP